MKKEYKELKEQGIEGLAELQELSTEFMQLDLSSLKSTVDFVEAYRSSSRQLHVMICNAGVSKANFGE